MPQKILIPYLYIEGHGPSDPVLHSGPLNTQFVYDRALSVHVHRFKDLEDFEARSKEIIHFERRWTIFPGVDAPDDLEETDDNSDELRLQLAACQAIAEFEPGVSLTSLGEFIADHPAVKGVYRMAGDLTDARALIKTQQQALLKANTPAPPNPEEPKTKPEKPAKATKAKPVAPKAPAKKAPAPKPAPKPKPKRKS